MMRRVPLHSFLAAILLILLIYSGNVAQTSLRSVARPVVVMLIAALLLWVPLALVLKSGTKAGPS